MRFEHSIIDPRTPGELNDVCLFADVNNDGIDEIIIGGKGGENNIVWYEYPSWKRHIIGKECLEAGGDTADLTGNGYVDLIVGNPAMKDGGNLLFWFENPGDPEKVWVKHIICDKFFKYHDQLVCDIDGDGKLEVVFSSQNSKVLGYYDIPEDPRTSPWPEDCLHIIAEGLEVEGLAVGDIDNDGETELVAGPNWFKRSGDSWNRNIIDESYQLTRVALVDLNKDGKLEIVVSEGESDPGRLTWFSAYPDFKAHVLTSDLFNPHSLDTADFTGNGYPDIFVGEMDLERNKNPKLYLYLNDGAGGFEQFLIEEGCGTHDAKVGIIGHDTKPSIVGKPYRPGRQVDLWRCVE
jgi:hypothetical protein